MSILADRLKSLIGNTPQTLQYLHALKNVNLPDGWIAGGYVRSLVWDHLHEYARPTPVNDIDVIYFDPHNTDRQAEENFAQQIEKICPIGLWEVRNQARMHLRNEDAPYKSAPDAMRYWLETPTAIAIRLDYGGNIEIAFPLGLEDLWSCISRPTAATRSRPARSEEYRQKVQTKKWQDLWPKLQVIWE